MNGNKNVSKICKNLEILRDREVTPILLKEAHMSVQMGTPIIRPLWWIDNSDPNNYRISDEFLVGNEILVAPITDENKFSRDIYFPKGNWTDPTNGKVIVGPQLVKDYPAPIEKIPYFKAN
jgi:alpha-glucosidase (family GH31 glycosyl hydrolase)